jgi:hypothetical protein
MKVVLSGGEGQVQKLIEEWPNSKGLVLRIDDGEAFLQLEVNTKEVRLTGDGGAHKRQSWEIEVAVPRVKEKRNG